MDGRLRRALLGSVGMLMAAVIIGVTFIADAVVGPAGEASPSPRPVASTPGPTPTTSTQAAQVEVDSLVKRFALSADVDERRQLVLEIDRLAATPGVTIPYR